ncbi:hypothetical protein [Bacillus sp. FJAT-53711]|uniref:hypothetical protein n=1 Tax=Bacillus yunxiaonensis TaxID=3127665 RepID=UPI0030132718
MVLKVEQTLVQTVRERDVITCWKENEYVMIAADKGHEQSTLMNRITKKFNKNVAR